MADDWVPVSAKLPSTAAPADDWMPVAANGSSPQAAAGKRGFPYDDPNTEYGSVLPLAKDTKTGSLSLAVPEMIRAPLRGVMSIGSKALGDQPQSYMQPLSGDEQSALMAVTGLRGPAGKAAEAASGLASEIRQAGKAGGGEFGEPLRPDLAQTMGDARVTVEDKAASIVSKRLQQDMKARGTSAQEIVDKLNEGKAVGKPVTLADVSPNVRALAGSVARRPGAGQAVIKDFLDERDASAGARMQSDISRDLTGGPSAYRTTKELLQTRQSEAQPLYDKAFEGGSMAPLRQQFEDAFNEASSAEREAQQAVAVAKTKLTQASGKQTQTQGNVYSTSAANQARRTAELEVRQAEQALAQAQQGKAMVLEKLRGAQDDIANNTPGAVWNPRIQQFLSDPVMKRGMARGLEIQRLEALAEGKRFDPTEYAISSEGEVLKVPNMRTLDAGKKGLDAIIESEGRDEFGRLNQMGRAVNQVRLAFLNEVDRINPDYAAARASWSGNSASLDALKFGKNLTRLKPEQIAEEFSAMTPNDQEFARLGAADALLERIGKTSFGGDEAKNLVRNEWVKGQLKPLFKSEDDFGRFVKSVAIERGMYDTKVQISGNSLTAARQAEDASNNLSGGLHAAHAISKVLGGNFTGGIRSGISAWRDLGFGNDEKLNEAIARIITDLGAIPELYEGKLRITLPQKPPGSPSP